MKERKNRSNVRGSERKEISTGRKKAERGKREVQISCYESVRRSYVTGNAGGSLRLY